MKFPLHKALLAFFASTVLLSATEALPQWNWLSSFQNSPANINSDDASKTCTGGSCVEAWRCPENFVISKNSKMCASKEDNDWVCCTYPSENDEYHSTTDLYVTKKSFRLPSASLEESRYVNKLPRDVIIDDKSRESSDIKFFSDEVHYSDTRNVEISENADYDPNSLKKVSNRFQFFKNSDDYWNSRTEKPLATYPTETNIWVWPESEDYYDKIGEKSIPQDLKPTHSSNFDDKRSPIFFPVPRRSSTVKLRTTQTGTTTRLNKTIHNPPKNTSTKLWHFDKNNKKTTSMPQVRTTLENHDNHFTKKMWSNNWQNRAKATENPQKGKVPLTTLTRKTTARSTYTSVVRHTSLPSTVTKPLSNFWNARTTSLPSRKSTTNSGYYSSSKEFNKNWNKPSTPSTWKKTTKYGGWKANVSNAITQFSTRRPTFISTQPWNSLIRRTTAQPYISKTNQPSYTNGWLWPESEEVKNDWNKKTSRRSTSTQASSVRNIGNSRSTTSSIRSTNRNPVSTPMPAVYGEKRWNRYQQPFQRIVGGEEAEPFSWPWVAALYKVTSPGGGNRFLSAGTLISKYYVLTAAHVFNSDNLRSSSYVVLLGTHNVTVSIAEYAVSTILLHPQYEKRYYYNDIALLRLEKPVRYNDLVMPVCLPTRTSALPKDSDMEGKRVTVMGWGDDSFGGRSSHVLREATFPIVSRRSCNASYVRVASNRFPRGITKEMLCAGSPAGGMDACQGDSGGPLLVWNNGRYTQVGIVSFGYKCGDKDFPGVYTKVSSYIEWITQNTQQRRS